MRKWVSATAIVAALVYAQPLLADTPASVYSDFAEDGVLSCGHSRSALKGALNDASLHQYGDPLTFLGLKLAVRRQLAGGCRRLSHTAATENPDASETAPGAGAPTSPSTGSRTRRNGGSTEGQRPLPETEDKAAVAEDTQAAEQSGGMVLVGVILLLLTLGSGGWAARRAFVSRQ